MFPNNKLLKWILLGAKVEAIVLAADLPQLVVHSAQDVSYTLGQYVMVMIEKQACWFTLNSLCACERGREGGREGAN